MKIAIVGASGKIGRAVDNQLSGRHDVVRIGSRSGDIRCDYTNPESVAEMLQALGDFDALVAAAGSDSTFGPYETLEDDDFRYGFERKFLAQVRLVRSGTTTIRDDGVFVLTSGFLSHYANPNSIGTGPLNAAVDTFVSNTAPLLPRGIRLNVVSPAPVVEPGREREGLVTAEQTAAFYIEAINGTMTGTILRAWGGLPEVQDS